jgi:hypothetical protein
MKSLVPQHSTLRMPFLTPAYLELVNIRPLDSSTPNLKQPRSRSFPSGKEKYQASRVLNPRLSWETMLESPKHVNQPIPQLALPQLALPPNVEEFQLAAGLCRVPQVSLLAPTRPCGSAGYRRSVTVG